MAFNKTNDVKVAGTLHSVAKSGILAHADEINTEKVFTGIKNDGSANTTTGNLETALENINSKLVATTKDVQNLQSLATTGLQFKGTIWQGTSATDSTGVVVAFNGYPYKKGDMWLISKTTNDLFAFATPSGSGTPLKKVAVEAKDIIVFTETVTSPSSALAIAAKEVPPYTIIQGDTEAPTAIPTTYINGLT